MNDTARAAMLRLLHGGAPGTALVAAARRREAWLPRFLADAENIPAGPVPYHTGSVLAHTARCMDAVAGDALAAWMALAHDAGKLTTPRAMWPHHYGHETRGERLVAVWARQLGLPPEYRQAGTLAARLHMKAGRYVALRPGKKFDLLHEVADSGFFPSFWKLVDADTRSAVSVTALRDWERISHLPYDRGEPDEKLRQQGISLLKSAHAER